MQAEKIGPEKNQQSAASVNAVQLYSKNSAKPLADNRSQSVQKKTNNTKSYPLKTSALVSSPVIQGKFFMGEVINNVPSLSPASLAKVDEVNKYIRAMGNNYPDRAFQLTIVNDRKTMPAYTNTNKLGDLNVFIQGWYVDVATVGEMTGMINHELGVHTLADTAMTDHEKQQEKNANPFDHTVHVGFRSHTLTGWTAGDNNWDQNRRQIDHLNVVKDNGVHPPKPRTQAYANTMLHAGDAIEADGTLSQAEKDKRLQDVLKVYLFDHARMLVTNDSGGPLKTGLKTHLIGDVMDWYRDIIINRHAATHPWLNRPAVQPNSSGWGLRAWLLGQAAMSFGAQFNHSAVGQSTVGTIARLPYNAASAVANSRIGTAAIAATSAVVNAPGIRHGIALAGTTARYGEMLVQDTASLVGSAVSGAWNLTSRLWGGGNRPHQH
jgi:hypothetical protein